MNSRFLSIFALALIFVGLNGSDLGLGGQPADLERAAQIKQAAAVASKKIDNQDQDLTDFADLLSKLSNNGATHPLANIVLDYVPELQWTDVESTELPEPRAVSHVQWNPNGSSLAIITGRYIKIIDPKTKNFSLLDQDPFNQGNYPRDLQHSPDGSLLAVDLGANGIKIWDTTTLQCLHTFAGAYAHQWIWSKDSTKLITLDGNTNIQMWDMTSGHFITLIGHTNKINSISLSADGTYFATGSDDRTIKTWDPATGNLLHTLRGIGPIACVHCSPTDPSLLLSATYNARFMYLWDLAKKSCKSLSLPGNYVGGGVRWSSDGKKIAYYVSSAQLLTTNLVIYDIPTATSKVTKIQAPRAFKWSPSGSYLTVKVFKDAHDALVVCDSDGNIVTSFDKGPRSRISGSYSWAPDESCLALCTDDYHGKYNIQLLFPKHSKNQIVHAFREYAKNPPKPKPAAPARAASHSKEINLTPKTQPRITPTVVAAQQIHAHKNSQNNQNAQPKPLNNQRAQQQNNKPTPAVNPRTYQRPIAKPAIKATPKSQPQRRLPAPAARKQAPQRAPKKAVAAKKRIVAKPPVRKKIVRPVNKKKVIAPKARMQQHRRAIIQRAAKAHSRKKAQAPHHRKIKQPVRRKPAAKKAIAPKQAPQVSAQDRLVQHHMRLMRAYQRVAQQN